MKTDVNKTGYGGTRSSLQRHYRTKEHEIKWTPCDLILHKNSAKSAVNHKHHPFSYKLKFPSSSSSTIQSPAKANNCICLAKVIHYSFESRRNQSFFQHAALHFFTNCTHSKKIILICYRVHFLRAFYLEFLLGKTQTFLLLLQRNPILTIKFLYAEGSKV